MDILRPAMLYIGDQCYRKNPLDASIGVPEDEEDTLVTEDVYCDEVCDAFSNIEKTSSGYKAVMDIPSAYFKFIIGKKAESKRIIENETRTQLRIPRAGEEGPVVIIGRDQKGVSSACTRIEVLVDSGRQRQPFTHFLSFPLTAQPITEGFLKFKEHVLQKCDADRGVEETIFQNPAKLHMTMGTLALMNGAEISKATQLLKECQESVLVPVVGERPLQAVFQGLEIMNDDPGAVDVLYAKVRLEDTSDRLQTLADLLVERFTSAGLMQKQYDRVKLHATVMNTLFRKDPNDSATPKPQQQDRNRRWQKPERESFDASNVLKIFGDYEFGSCPLNTIHLSQRYSTGADGYYTSAASLKL